MSMRGVKKPGHPHHHLGGARPVPGRPQDPGRGHAVRARPLRAWRRPRIPDSGARAGPNLRPCDLGSWVCSTSPRTRSPTGASISTPSSAVAHGLDMVRTGADVVDVGGESSRPGAEPVSEREELRRVVPVIEALSPARAGVGRHRQAGRGRGGRRRPGATLVNDISASLWPVAAESGVGWVAMHMQGEPRTMQHRPALRRRRRRGAPISCRGPGPRRARGRGGRGVGGPRHRLRQDRRPQPGPVAPSARARGRGLAGAGGNEPQELPGTPGAGPAGRARGVDDRLAGSIATATWAMLAGASMVRVHDVSGARQAATLVGATRRPRARCRQ